MGRLAVWVEDHPDVFRVNYVVDHGTLVFRTTAGTKLSAALSDVPVALEIDGYDASRATAWSVVVKGRAEQIRATEEFLHTVDLLLFPWQAGPKGWFVRVQPGTVTGRRFGLVSSKAWGIPWTDAPQSPLE